MWPAPESSIAARMTRAFTDACGKLRVRADENSRKVWGWHGRTLSSAVDAGPSPAWLRLASAPADAIATTFWTGSIDAEGLIPKTVPRPRLIANHDFTDGGNAYRAELFERVLTPTISTKLVLDADLDLPDSWWSALRNALAELETVPTARRTVQQTFLDAAMPHFLGEPIDTRSNSPWVTAHGDLHFANLCEPLCFLDWEGWGLAPVGYDVAVLHTYSLRAPRTAARIRKEFPLLAGSDGHFAELVAITQQLRSASASNDRQPVGVLRARARKLLGRSIPASRRQTA